MSLPQHREALWDVEKIRGDFPILRQKIRGRDLVYLDNAATSQKPEAVIEAVSRYYREYNANIHRGVHLLSEKASEAHEEARNKVARFLHARTPREIIFVRGTTEAINLVAQSFGRMRVKAGDEILIATTEHHSNIVPWQLLREATGAVLKVIPVSDAGELLMGEYEKLLTERTRIVAIGHVSNALGTVHPVKDVIRLAHEKGVPVLLDGAQAVPHLSVDVQDLDCDFYAFSGHKMCGPTGIGVLYGKEKHLKVMPPYQGGGDMIASVSFEKTTYNELPYKFEAGTPDIAGAIGLGVAVDYYQSLGMPALEAYEDELLAYATESLAGVQGLRIIGASSDRVGVVSFVMEGVHPHDIGTILDREGIAIRTGHHCAMPLMRRLGVPATARASLAFYNTKEEIDALLQGLEKVREVLHV